MSRCSSNKNSYETEDLAIEALLQNHIRNFHRTNGGPINIYTCRECGLFHFTSKGEINKALMDESNKKRIKKEQQADYWERKLR